MYLDVGYDSLLIAILQIIKQCFDETTAYKTGIVDKVFEQRWAY